MGSKGNKSTTQTAQTQTYTPNPQIQQSGELAMNQAIGAAQSPFSMPVAPVAGFNPFQQQAFGQVQGAQGMTDPYFAQARSYIDQSASPLTGGTVNEYFNPMTDAVTAQLKNIFGQQNRQATGTATQAAGGVGADRIGVAQGNLANQQTLGAGQVYSQLYQQAVQNAQADKARQQSAGYAYGQLGPAAQAANLQATSALGGAGNQQQQQQQQELNAPWMNLLAKIAYPFQTSQFLAGITGGLAPAFGGTTSGYGNSQTQTPTPSPLNQILGVGTAGIGALGSAGAFGTGNGGSQIGSTYGAADNGSGFGYGSYGGVQVPTYFAEGGEVGGDESSPPPFPYLSLPKTGASPIPTIHLPMGGGQFHNNLNLSPPQQSGKSDSGSSGLGDVAKIASAVLPFVLARGGAVSPYAMGEGFQEGGDIDEGESWEPEPLQGIDAPMGTPYQPSFADRFEPAVEHPLKKGVPYPDAHNAPFETGESIPFPKANPLGGLTPGMRRDFPAIRQAAAERGVNFDIGEGYRPQERQEGLYAQGRFTRGPIVTGTRNSNHTSGNAVDVLPTGGTTDRQIGDTLTDLTMHDPRFANMRSGAQFSNLYDPRHIELLGNREARTPGEPGINTGAGTEVAGIPEAGKPIAFNPYNRANEDMKIGNYHLAKGDQPYPDALNRDWGQRAVRSPWMSLIHAGAAIASTTGPVGTAIAKGIGAGAGSLENQRKELRTEQDQNLKADHLFQQAKMHLDKYQRETPHEANVSDYHRELLRRTKFTPVNIEVMNDKGEPETIAARFDPATGTYTDSSGKPVEGRLIARQTGAESATSKANHALSTAKDDPQYLIDQEGTINKHRAREGLPPRAGLGTSADSALPDPGEEHRKKNLWYLDPVTGKPRQWI